MPIWKRRSPEEREAAADAEALAWFESNKGPATRAWEAIEAQAEADVRNNPGDDARQVYDRAMRAGVRAWKERQAEDEAFRREEAERARRAERARLAAEEESALHAAQAWHLMQQNNGKNC
jgi:hypothetical protein